jgi:hypothetical protein
MLLKGKRSSNSNVVMTPNYPKKTNEQQQQLEQIPGRTKSSVRKIDTFLSIFINRDFWSRFLLHKKAMKSGRTKSSVRKIDTFLSILINRDFWLRFLLHKKALKSFLHSLTIYDKVASGNKKIGIP